ncbi:N-acetylated-alpha-linked acidic dipeptidase [Chitinophaga costaii]|uniref:N-acetylated-alpha-linked acidic dipeptidase n=1 Tax=Chitinophaga costaii TaxID=1335309 RepID=A0A1C4CAF1_9BACT|nr:transferrin receptor-like dimerization domain-containing protein [Chitinophaga costaii]PUZ27168.1 folate hydrolase [Chitinophaga costaii]SCC16091.1 N-acetylated-alpha-linked acidic dipeptidase [Chitinophaga costaii]
MTKNVPALLAGLLICLPSVLAQQHPLLGFPDSAAAIQTRWEAQFDQQLSAAHIGANIKELSAYPHHLGAARDKAVAENIAQQFKSYGWEVQTETYQVLFSTPRTRTLELVGVPGYHASLKEPALPEDATSGQEGQLPTYNCWSADGDVTGPLVYVNYGLPEDYEWLDRIGVSVKGKIVIARYGRAWRGIKPKVAQEHGAIGCLIYSDPHDDGYFQGDVYPKGPYKNEYGVQRGSVMDFVVYPGDPLTPGIGATADAKRLDRSKAPNLLKMPVLPISYHDAQPLLAALQGPVAPATWRGGLPITYHIGGQGASVHLTLAFDWGLKPAYDVIATFKGARYPDEWVVRGNHHDAWINGASDPVTGLSAMLEEAQAIGALARQGYRPARTLVYCAWDGEEQGLLGSTEWVETHAAALQKKAVAYINTDNNGRGFLEAAGSHALQPLVNEVSRGVTDPETHVSLWERARAAKLVHADNTKAKKELLDASTLTIDALGSGSDYSPFLQHTGVPSLNLGFGGEDGGGEYHSIYDSYDDFMRFKDPTFAYQRALAQVAGRIVLRLAGAVTLPFDFRTLHKTISNYLDDLVAATEAQRTNTAIENKLIRSGQYDLASDPQNATKAPLLRAEVPFVDFSPLQNALVALQLAADTIAARQAAGAASPAFNEGLYRAEQQLLTSEGLPKRTWYKHTIYAPGYYTGYGVKTLPGVREAIEQRQWKEAADQVVVAATAVNKLATYLREVANK